MGNGRKRRLIAVLIFVLAAATVLGACNSGSKQAGSGKSATLVFWNSAYPTVDENDKTKKKEDFYIYQAIQRFEAANPDIKIDLQDVPGGGELFTKFQTANIAKNGPDLTALWSGTYTLQYKQFLEPLNDYFTQEEKDQIVGWESVTDGFKEGGQIYGVPLSTDGTVVLFYNKQIFADAGVDPVADRPKNFPEFVAMLEQLKTTGKIPFGIKLPDTFTHTVLYWMAQTLTTSGLGELVEGKQSFNTPQLAAIMAGWQELNKRGLVMAEASDQAGELYYKGEVAMITAGNTIIANARAQLGDNFGMMKVPDFSEDAPITNGGVGGIGNAFVVTNYSENKEQAVKFIKFLMSKDEQINKIKVGEAALSIVKGVDVNEYVKDEFMLQMQEWANEPSTVFWPDNVFPAELTNELVTLQALVLNGQMTAENFLEKIDAKRDEILKSAQ